MKQKNIYIVLFSLLFTLLFTRTSMAQDVFYPGADADTPPCTEEQMEVFFAGLMGKEVPPPATPEDPSVHPDSVEPLCALPMRSVNPDTWIHAPGNIPPLPPEGTPTRDPHEAPPHSDLEIWPAFNGVIAPLPLPWYVGTMGGVPFDTVGNSLPTEQSPFDIVDYDTSPVNSVTFTDISTFVN